MNISASPVLDMDGFTRTLVHNISSSLGPGFEVTVSDQEKNNRITYTCLTIRHRDNKISPNIRVDELFSAYKKGIWSMEEITRRIIESYENIDQETTGLEDLYSDPQKLSDKIFYRLINYERNCEILDSFPHFRILDLAIVFCLSVTVSNDESGSVKIDNRLASIIGLDADKLLTIALRNTPKLFPSEFGDLDDLIADIMRKRGVPEHMIPVFMGGCLHSPMKVLTNDKEYFGASCILYPGLLKKFREELGKDFFIIPSSVNETIIVPADCTNIDHLREMVRDVNQTVVPPDQILSDNIYCYPSDFDKDFIAHLLS